MNLTKEQRSYFTIFIVLANVDQGTSLRNSLLNTGYEVFLFTDHDVALERIKQAPPHLVIFAKESLSIPVSEFVENILNLNPEVLFVPLAPAKDSIEFNEYRQYNFPAIVLLGEGLAQRLSWSIDEICLRLYLTFQNEQMLDQLQMLENKASQHDSELQKMKEKLQRAPAGSFDLSKELVKYSGASSKEEYIQVFFRSLGQKFLRNNSKLSAVYFKYLSTVQSFVPTGAIGFEISRLKGVGIQVSQEENKDVLEFLRSGKIPIALQEFLQEGLRLKEFVVRPVLLHKSIDGLVVAWTSGPFSANEFENEFQIFNLLYERAHLVKKVTDLDVVDPVTELYNFDYHMKKLTEEVARARRLLQPVSVIKIAIDQFRNIEKEMGRGNLDMILRTVANMVRKTSRVNDISSWTRENEVSVILPHSPRKGASLRAERLRRMIESHSFSTSGLRVTVSAGVSEYPSISKDATELENSAREALDFIQNKGGNKVCLFKASPTFKPDFEVPMA